MLKKLIFAKLGKIEKELGVSIDYLRYIVKTSTKAFF